MEYNAGYLVTASHRKYTQYTRMRGWRSSNFAQICQIFILKFSIKISKETKSQLKEKRVKISRFVTFSYHRQPPSCEPDEDIATVTE